MQVPQPRRKPCFSRHHCPVSVSVSTYVCARIRNQAVYARVQPRNQTVVDLAQIPPSSTRQLRLCENARNKMDATQPTRLTEVRSD